MIIKHIEGATRELGKAQGFMVLPIKDTRIPVRIGGDTVFTRAMLSAWEPTPEELAKIAAGAPIILTVLGINHPPVNMTVGEIPNDQPVSTDATSP